MNIANEIVTVINVIDTLLNFFSQAKHPNFSKDFLDNQENQIKAFNDHLKQKYKESCNPETKEGEVVN